MAVRDILQLGHPTLYATCAEVQQAEVDTLAPAIEDLFDTLHAFQETYGAGRAMAAPQIGLLKRIVVQDIDGPVVYINPVLTNQSAARMDVWDDCMSFPDLLVHVRRHTSCTLHYRTMDWSEQRQDLEGAMAELLQHEVDHLDGILAIHRAVGPRAIALRSQRKHLPPFDAAGGW